MVKQPVVRWRMPHANPFGVACSVALHSKASRLGELWDHFFMLNSVAESSNEAPTLLGLCWSLAAGAFTVL